MVSARPARRDRGKDFAAMPGILYYPPHDRPAVISDLRKDEPKTAVEMWQRRVQRSGAKVAFRHKKDGKWATMTWGEADAAAREIAAGLVAQGVVPGDRICLLSQTRLEWLLCDVGILLAGGVTVPIYASNTAEQCEFIVRDAGAKVVIVEDAAQLEKLVPLRHRLFTVMSLVHIAGDGTLEKADAKGRTVVTVAEATQGAADFVQSLEGLRAAGRAWAGAHPGSSPTTPARSAPIQCSRSSTRRGPPGTRRAWC